MAAWAAEYAGYLTTAAEHLRQTAKQAEDRCVEALIKRKALHVTSQDELEPEELRLAAKARSMSHASALLALLAIEIALKGYQIRDKGERTRGHDLQCLFDTLNKETKARLEELGPEVEKTLKKYRKGFVSLRYQFEELGNLKKVSIPRPSDPSHKAATRIVDALIEDVVN